MTGTPPGCLSRFGFLWQVRRQIWPAQWQVHSCPGWLGPMGRVNNMRVSVNGVKQCFEIRHVWSICDQTIFIFAFQTPHYGPTRTLGPSKWSDWNAYDILCHRYVYELLLLTDGIHSGATRCPTNLMWVSTLPIPKRIEGSLHTDTHAHIPWEIIWYHFYDQVGHKVIIRYLIDVSRGTCYRCISSYLCVIEYLLGYLLQWSSVIATLGLGWSGPHVCAVSYFAWFSW